MGAYNDDELVMKFNLAKGPFGLILKKSNFPKLIYYLFATKICRNIYDKYNNAFIP